MSIPLRFARFLVLIAALACSTAAQTPATQTRPATPAAPAVTAKAPPAQAGATRPPVAQNSVRFAVIGDTGTGDRNQYEVGAMLAKSRLVFPYEFVIMMGDNIYGSERPQDFVDKFEVPYKPILDAKVLFYASLGNHDDPNQRFYKPFNMNGQRFYTFQKPETRFFALDSNYMDKDQVTWLEKELAASRSKWKIAYFHHPLYSSGAKHGSEVDLRAIVEPLFIKYGVSVVFSGHEHFYERLKPQNGIQYFTSGGGAKLRPGNIVSSSAITAKGFDTDLSYMLVEIDGDEMHFQTLSRSGREVDSGVIHRRITPTETSSRQEW